ncbi:hypothetical protein [Alishewanella phage vB_AspM_Slickus01]|nr:hypothetical protein [Alishewanella phage vB_AspM_Slickus01]
MVGTTKKLFSKVTVTNKDRTAPFFFGNKIPANSNAGGGGGGGNGNGGNGGNGNGNGGIDWSTVEPIILTVNSFIPSETDFQIYAYAATEDGDEVNVEGFMRVVYNATDYFFPIEMDAGEFTHNIGQIVGQGEFQLLIYVLVPNIPYECSISISGGEKVIGVESFGSGGYNGISFPDNDITIVPSVLPSELVHLGGMFQNNRNFNHPNVTLWDVSNVISTSFMFSGCYAFNQNITSVNWDVSSVQYMNQMFRDATSFNQDIGGWNVINVIQLFDMFYGATLFNQNLTCWLVENSASSKGLNFSKNSALDNFYENKPLWFNTNDDGTDRTAFWCQI